MHLVEDRPTNVSVQYKMLHKIGIGKNGCCGAQALQVIRRLPAPVIPGDGHLLLTCVLAGHQIMQGLGHLHELGDEAVIVSCELKKAPGLVMVVGGGHLLIASILPSSVAIP